MTPRRANWRWWEDPRYVPTEVRLEIERRLLHHWKPDLDRQVERSCAKWFEAMNGSPPSPYAHKIKSDGQTPGVGRLAEALARVLQMEDQHREILREVRAMRQEQQERIWARHRRRSEGENGMGVAG